METELIERFFSKQCTREEAEEVVAYLKIHPAVLEKYSGMHEWYSVVTNNDRPEEFWSEIWHNIQKKKRARIVYLRIKRIAAAACIIFLIGTVYYFLTPGKKINQPVARISSPLKAQRHIVSNISKKVIKIVLEDSSAVELSPNSSIQYEIPFSKNTREIYLEGEAKFYVAKNKAKPFTVYADVLATTALGTIFSIKKSGKKNDITVKLFQGKVVIHSTDADLAGWNKDVYLLPGEQMKFDSEKMLVAVKKINNSNINSLVKIKKQVTGSLNDDALIFNNTLLPEVMRKLSLYYNTKIQYDSMVVSDMNFTGTVSKNDSLSVILKAISQMNDLNVLKNNNEFIITKDQQ